MIKATINKVEVEVPEGTTILEAARIANFTIPTLCRHPDLVPEGSCGLCVVEVEGFPALRRACVTQLEKGWKVSTNTARVRNARETARRADPFRSRRASVSSASRTASASCRRWPGPSAFRTSPDYMKKATKPLDTTERLHRAGTRTSASSAAGASRSAPRCRRSMP